MMKMETGRERSGIKKSVAVLGFARRRRLRAMADRAWHETVTHYTPEPWLIALEHERNVLPFKLGRQPAANR